MNSCFLLVLREISSNQTRSSLLLASPDGWGWNVQGGLNCLLTLSAFSSPPLANRSFFFSPLFPLLGFVNVFLKKLGVPTIYVRSFMGGRRPFFLTSL